MKTRRLYVQFCVILAASLLIFASLAGLLSHAFSDDRWRHEIFDKTTSLAMLLLPPHGASKQLQTDTVQKIGDILDFDITLLSPDGQLIAARGPVAEAPSVDLAGGGWLAAEGKSQWMTGLPDGRVLILDIGHVEVPSNTLGIVLAFLLLALFIAVFSYPFIRRITKRLELLQQQVQQVGAGDLSARIEVSGSDEVAALAESFNKSAEQIEALVTAQRMLIANASHELRTPLARIRLGIELLQGRNDSKRLESLKCDIRELDDLIDELILMARLETGLQEGDLQSVDLKTLAAKECSRYKNCGLVGSQGEVLGDHRMLQRLVRNLIDNAYMHGKPPVDVRIIEDGTTVSLTVTDCGEGIPLAEQRKVLQPFYRGADKQNVPGYGLGLPIVERIAAVHHGSIEIQNKPASISVVFSSPDLLVEQHEAHARTRGDRTDKVREPLASYS